MKNIFDYKIWIFDLDGTLYHQLPVRLEMALRLIFYYAIRPHRLKELFMLKDYRNLREKRFKAEEENFQELQIELMAQKYKMDSSTVEKIIDRWLIKNPLKVIKRWQRKKMLSTIKTQQSQGKTIIIYSDYPVAEKLQALDLNADYKFWSNDEIINCMKPNSKGLKNIIESLKLNCKEILYVGDRDDRDKICAEGANVDYLDVNEFEKIISLGGDYEKR